MQRRLGILFFSEIFVRGNFGLVCRRKEGIQQGVVVGWDWNVTCSICFIWLDLEESHEAHESVE